MMEVLKGEHIDEVAPCQCGAKKLLSKYKLLRFTVGEQENRSAQNENKITAPGLDLTIIRKGAVEMTLNFGSVTPCCSESKTQWCESLMGDSCPSGYIPEE